MIPSLEFKKIYTHIYVNITFPRLPTDTKRMTHLMHKYVKMHEIHRSFMEKGITSVSKRKEEWK